MREAVDRRSMAVLSTGHMMADTWQGAVPALLPFLIDKRGYSYAAASALVLAATVASSLIQPAFGHFSDRRSLAWLMPAGVLLGGVGIALVGVASDYALTFLAVVISGLGVAAFHPEGSRFANYVSGAKRASGMSLFSLGGNVGFALGPILVTPLVIAFGLSGTLLLLIPTVAVFAWIAIELPRLTRFRPDEGPAAEGAGSPDDDWAGFAKLAGVIAFRTFVYFGLITFVPLYFVHELGTSKATGNTALALMLIGGAVGTLIGGPLADRIGRRAVIVGSMALTAPLIVLFHLAGELPALVLAFVIGAVVIATFSVTVVMGQEFLPGRIGVASGVTLGLSIGLGGVGAPLLGVVADATSLNTVLWVVAALPLLGLAMAVWLPSEPRPRERRHSGSPRRVHQLQG
ncbi:MAG: MFS transporter [Thermoleophilaceae bacterium]